MERGGFTLFIKAGPGEVTGRDGVCLGGQRASKRGLRAALVSASQGQTGKLYSFEKIIQWEREACLFSVLR